MHQAFRGGFEKTAFLWANPNTFKDHLAVLKHYRLANDPKYYVKALRDNVQLGRHGAEVSGNLDTYRALLRKEIKKPAASSQ